MNVLTYFLLLIVFIILILVSRKTPKQLGDYPYEKQEFLLTKPEVAFYNQLKPIAIERNLIIMSKVRLWDIIHVTRGTEKRMSYENKIKSKHIDFVLCDANSMKIVLVIELDDKSHLRKDRIASDEFKNNALSAAKIPLLRFVTQKTYNNELLTKEISEKIK